MARVFVANSRKLTQKKGGKSTSRLVRKLMFISVDGDDDVRCKLSAVMNGNNRGSHLLFCVCVCPSSGNSNALICVGQRQENQQKNERNEESHCSRPCLVKTHSYTHSTRT